MPFLSFHLPRQADPARLTLGDIHDRGYVFVDAAFAGMVSREQDMYDLAIYARPNQTISIVVESQGRICFGSHINDFKVRLLEGAGGDIIFWGLGVCLVFTFK